MGAKTNGSFSNGKRGTLSEINVTPFVDVMLVLLIIFMVTAPLMQQGLDVNLPQAKGKDLTPEERINIFIKRDGTLVMNDAALSLRQMKARLETMSKSNPNVFLRADRNVSYGLVVKVMAEVKEAGIERLGIVTEPVRDSSGPADTARPGEMP